MSNWTFANPEFFYLLIIIPIISVWYFFKRKNFHPTLKLSTLEPSSAAKPSSRQRFIHIPFLLRMLALALLIVALARPQSRLSPEAIVKIQGIDIVLTIDISTSMLAEDFRPNRLEAAKKTAVEFIESRLNDRIGLVLFSAESYTQCPITTDHLILKSLFKDVKTGMIQDGTAIGMGLATAVNRLKDSKAISKVIILLTDGVNNTGLVAPLTAAEIAKTFGIRVYTIGVGTRGKAPYPMPTPMGVVYQNVDVQIDEDVLTQIADITGGKYFRATSNKALEDIYTEIDAMEKTIIDEKVFVKQTEEFFPITLLAGCIFILEQLLSFFVFRRLP